MSSNEHLAAVEMVATLTERTLSGVLTLAARETKSAHEFARQIDIAQLGLNFINLSPIKPNYNKNWRLFKVLNSNCDVAAYAQQFAAQPELEVNQPAKSAKSKKSLTQVNNGSVCQSDSGDQA